MVDTRPRAYEKARKRAAELKAQRDALQENNPVQAGKPPGAGFESERQRAKTALRDELDTFDGTGVHKIIASSERAQEDRIEKLQDDMMEALFAPATEPEEDGDDE